MIIDRDWCLVLIGFNWHSVEVCGLKWKPCVSEGGKSESKLARKVSLNTQETFTAIVHLHNQRRKLTY